MKDYELTVDVGITNSAKMQSYRLYVDNDLITERTFVWDHTKEFVREKVYIRLEPGDHSVRVEPAVSNFFGFFCKLVKLNDQILYKEDLVEACRAINVFHVE